MIRNREAIRRLMSRVMSRRWSAMLAFLLFGFVVSSAVYCIWPAVYEAKSVFTMDVQPPKGDYDENSHEMDYYSDDYGEIFEMQRTEWRSKDFFSRIIRQFRLNYPDSTVTDKALGEMLENSMLERIGHSSRMRLTAYSPTAELAAALANTYVETIKTLTDERYKECCEKALVQIHKQVERAKNFSSELYQDLLRKEKEHRIVVEKSYERAFVLRTAQVPARPIVPNPRVIFPIGAVLSLGLGLLFCQWIQRRVSMPKGRGETK